MAVLRGTATGTQTALLNLGSGTSKAATEAAKLADQQAETIASLRDELLYTQDLREAQIRGADAVAAVKDAREADQLIQRLKLDQNGIEAAQIRELIQRRNDERRAIEAVADSQKNAERAAEELARAQKRAAEESTREYQKVIDNIRDFSERALADSFYESLRGKTRSEEPTYE